jgi:hypothetical protein
VEDLTHIATSGRTPNTAVCWVVNGPLSVRKTTTNPAESDCFDCRKLNAAFEELEAAAAEVGEHGSAIQKFLDDYDA